MPSYHSLRFPLKRPLAGLLLVVSGAPILIASQTPQEVQPKPKAPRFSATATAVVLDVVVRDKRGRPVTDLSAADFEIFEDGKPQKVDTFQLVMDQSVRSAGDPSQPSLPADPAPAPPEEEFDPYRDARFVAMVFDRLSSEARSFAHKAAGSYLKEHISGGADMVGIFSIDLALHVIQDYTNDSDRLLQAVEAVGTQSTSSFISGNADMRAAANLSDRLGQSAATSAAVAAAGGPDTAGAALAAGQATGQSVADQAVANMNLRMLETFEVLQRDQQGYATTNGLLAVVQSLSALWGRKTLIFFSEGMAIPPAVQARFRSVINAANRANVSIYTLDAAGLRLESPGAEAARELNALANRRINQNFSGREDTSGPMMRSLERNEDLLRLDPHSGLGQLADETGGFLIAETNDLNLGLRYIDEDMRAYYMLSYTPTNFEYDGDFRKIEVKIKRPGVKVQTRKGYFGVSDVGDQPLLDYEAPALAASDSLVPPGDFPVRLTGLAFPAAESGARVPLLVEVPPGHLTYRLDEKEERYFGDFSILVLIRNQEREIVRKVSQQYQLSGEAAGLEQAREGSVLFYRQIDLQPGRYALEAITHDALVGQAGIQTADLLIEAPTANRPRVSSIVIIRNAEQLPDKEVDRENPLHFGKILIYPYLGEPISARARQQLPFYFTAIPAADDRTPQLTVEVIHGEKLKGRMSTQLPPPDEIDRIAYASALPIADYEAGHYTLRITVGKGESAVTRSAGFVLE